MGNRMLISATVQGLLHRRQKKIYFLSKMTVPVFEQNNREVMQEIKDELSAEPFGVNLRDVENGLGVLDGIKS